MESLRRRVPFKFSDDEIHENDVLDEQEQEQLVQNLRNQNERSKKQYRTFIRVIIALSALIQFTHLLTPTHSNPILSLFPEETPSSRTTIPFATGFTLLSLLVHCNLALLLHPNEVRDHLQLTYDLKPLSYDLLYALSAVPATLSLFLRLPWQTTAWWTVTAAVVFVVHTVMDTIESNTQSISDLDSMRYVAPGA